MIIANPIYDVVFKKLMQNERVAKFFIGTLLDENIISLQIKPQEYAFDVDLENISEFELEKIKSRIRERNSIWVYRYDFIATIKTETGEIKKVLIEIQKAKNIIDIMRFRNYLAEQYKKVDVVEEQSLVLPITTIYILGFTLPEINTPCLKVERNYLDQINKVKIETKSDFIEKLTHDSFIVQVERIADNYQTKLDKLLSIFEQSNFVGDNKIIKEFKHSTDSDEMKILTDILHFSGTDPLEKKKIEDEQEAYRTIDALTEGLKGKVEAHLKTIEQQGKVIEVNEKILQENEKILQENEKILQEKDKTLQEKDKTLQEKDKTLQEKDKTLQEKDILIAELLKKLDGN
jgi:hypothetical protein